jgi:hypothetical protein
LKEPSLAEAFEFVRTTKPVSEIGQVGPPTKPRKAESFVMTFVRFFRDRKGGASFFAFWAFRPTAAITFAGGAGTGTSCTQIIGDTITFVGNSALAINCSGYETKPFSPAIIKLAS